MPSVAKIYRYLFGLLKNPQSPLVQGGLSFIVISFLVFFIWQYVDGQEKNNARLTGQAHAQVIAARLETMFSERTRVLAHAAELWRNSQDRSRDRFDQIASHAVGYLGDLAAASWLEGTTIRYTVLAADARQSEGVDLVNHPILGPWFAETGVISRPRLSPRVDLLQGGQGVVLYVPVMPGEPEQGLLSAVFRLPALEAEVVDAKEGEKAFDTTVFDGDVPVLFGSTTMDRNRVGGLSLCFR